MRWVRKRRRGVEDQVKNSPAFHSGEPKLPGGDRWREFNEEIAAIEPYEVASKPCAREPAGAKLGPQRLLEFREVAGKTPAVVEASNLRAERTSVHGDHPPRIGERTLGEYLPPHPARGRHRRGEQSQQGPVDGGFPYARCWSAPTQGVRFF